MQIYATFGVYVIILMSGTISESKNVGGAVQFRITESEFNKVANVLLQPQDAYTIDDRDDETKGVYNGISYQFKHVTKRVDSKEVNARIPEDGIMIVTTFLPTMQLSGKIKLTRLNDSQVMYDGNFRVTVTNVTLMSYGVEDTSKQVVSLNSLSSINLDLSNCSADIKGLLVDQDFQQIIALLHMSQGDLIEIFRSVVCKTNKMRNSLGFGEMRITFHALGQPLVAATRACCLEIKNKTFLITQKVTSSFKEKDILADRTADVSPPFPPLGATSEPFEIVLQTDILNELFRKFKRQLGIGVQKLSVTDLLPNLKDLTDKLSTDGMYMMLLFPRVRDTYPDAVADMIVQDAEIYCTLEDGSLKLHFDIAADMAVTLNCDKNRTYSAFNFTMNLFFPVQVGHNNKNMTMKVLGFGGNFTVINSTVGHVVDRATRSILYSAPYLASKGLGKLNDEIQGIPLADFLPENVYAVVNNISVKRNSVIIGGNLSLTDPQLPLIDKSDIVWVGKTVPEDDLILLGFDHTPPELEPEKERNCKPPPPVASASVVTYQVLLQCVMIMVICMYWGH